VANLLSRKRHKNHIPSLEPVSCCGRINRGANWRVA